MIERIRNQGFTLVELLVVISITTLLEKRVYIMELKEALRQRMEQRGIKIW